MDIACLLVLEKIKLKYNYRRGRNEKISEKINAFNLDLLVLLTVGSVVAYADEQCICETKCIDGEVNDACLVCAVKNASLN